MFKVSGFATMLALALSLIAVSCSGPVFFKSPVAVAPSPAPAAPAVAVASTGAVPAVTVPVSTGAVAAGSVASTTQPVAQQTPLAFLSDPGWKGAEVFGAFAGAFLVMIAISKFVVSDASKKSRA